MSMIEFKRAKTQSAIHFAPGPERERKPEPIFMDDFSFKVDKLPNLVLSPLRWLTAAKNETVNTGSKYLRTAPLQFWDGRDSFFIFIKLKLLWKYLQELYKLHEP